MHTCPQLHTQAHTHLPSAAHTHTRTRTHTDKYLTRSQWPCSSRAPAKPMLQRQLSQHRTRNAGRPVTTESRVNALEGGDTSPLRVRLELRLHTSTQMDTASPRDTQPLPLLPAAPPPCRSPCDESASCRHVTGQWYSMLCAAWR